MQHQHRAMLIRQLAQRPVNPLPQFAPLQARGRVHRHDRHLPRDAATLREAAARLDRLALATGRRVNRLLAAEVVAELADNDDNCMLIDEDNAYASSTASHEAFSFL